MELKYVILYVILINALGLAIMALDKFKAEKGFWRVPEKTLFVVTLLGGGIGTISEIAIIIYLLYKGILQMIII